MSVQTGMPADIQLLDDIVAGLIRRHNIVAGDLTTEFRGEIIQGSAGWEGRIEQVALAKAMTLAAETLARIIFAIPDADLYNVHGDTWLGKREPGPYLLQKIAATAIVCRIRAKLRVSTGTTRYVLRLEGPNPFGLPAQPEYVVPKPGPGPHQHD